MAILVVKLHSSNLNLVAGAPATSNRPGYRGGARCSPVLDKKRESWQPLVELSSQSLPQGAPRRFEANIVSSKEITGLLRGGEKPWTRRAYAGGPQ
jgi:hypothetical protein